MMIAHAAILLMAATAIATEVRVVGTDLLGPEVARALYEFSGRAGLPLALALDGSRPGLNQLKAGRADLALLVRTPGENENMAGFQSVTLAYHCVFLLVPTSVPLERVTLDELRNIFGENGASNLRRWGDLGLRGDLAASAIVPHVPAMGQGITAEFFGHTALRGRPFRSTAVRYATLGELTAQLVGDQRALALSPRRPPEASDLKIVPVAARAEEPAFPPTAENLRSGDYPLGLPLQIVFRRESARTLRPLLGFLFSDEFAMNLELAGVVPLAAAARRQQALVVEQL